MYKESLLSSLFMDLAGQLNYILCVCEINILQSTILNIGNRITRNYNQKFYCQHETFYFNMPYKTIIYFWLCQSLLCPPILMICTFKKLFFNPMYHPRKFNHKDIWVISGPWKMYCVSPTKAGIYMLYNLHMFTSYFCR